jgi:hypothetical protein
LTHLRGIHDLRVDDSTATVKAAAAALLWHSSLGLQFKSNSSLLII